MLLAEALQKEFSATPFTAACDDCLDFSLPTANLKPCLRYLRDDWRRPYRCLWDLTAMDERPSGGGFTLIYHLFNYAVAEFLRLRVPLPAGQETAPSLTDLYANANWYEREVYDLFGLRFAGHPDLRRILLPPQWRGHPLRKEEAIRATERPPIVIDREHLQERLGEYQRSPDGQALDDGETMVLNVGPHHPGTHGILRYILRLRGEEIVAVDPDIGYHHRGVEKIAEGHSYHNFIPYTDRVDYLGGVLGEWPYLRAIEKLAAIHVPERAEGIRTLLAELCRISSHLVWLGSYGNDLGTMGPAFYAFRDRAWLLELMERFTGGRLHPQFFRIGGVADDLPEGWRSDLLALLRRIEKGLPDSERLTVENPIFRARTEGVGVVTAEQAERWCATSILLRSTGRAFDLRKAAPYGLYDRVDFEVPVTTAGDAWSRTWLHIAEIRESIRILRQLADILPEGPTLACDAPLALMPKSRTLLYIETLIHHFEQMADAFGPPPGSALGLGESARGLLGYFVVSDGGPKPYRLRVRTGSFAHVQMITELGRGLRLPDFIATIGSLDYVLADLDR